MPPTTGAAVTEKRSSNRDIAYSCSRCDASVGRENLTAVTVIFKTMGVGWKVLKSRTTEWLCASCRDADPIWNSESRAASPGMADTKMADLLRDIPDGTG